MISGVRVRPERMRAAAAEGFSTATDLADYLVARGVPFRDAHEAVAGAVRDAAAAGVDLADLDGARLKAIHPVIGDDVRAVLTVDGSVAARRHVGGTAPEQVASQVRRHRDRLATD